MRKEYVDRQSAMLREQYRDLVPVVNDFRRLFPSMSMPTVSCGYISAWVAETATQYTFDGHGRLLSEQEIDLNAPLPPDQYRDEHGIRFSRQRCQCGHQRHDGRCEGGDDDGDGYIDWCSCDEHRDQCLGP